MNLLVCAVLVMGFLLFSYMSLHVKLHTGKKGVTGKQTPPWKLSLESRIAKKSICWLLLCFIYVLWGQYSVVAKITAPGTS